MNAIRFTALSIGSILFLEYLKSLLPHDQTLSPGANVASTVSTSASGSTICLNSGNYGAVSFSNISKSNYVKIQSTSARGATISPQISNSKYLQFENLTISGSTIYRLRIKH